MRGVDAHAKINLALVLDNTGSMASSGKMTNLKSAAHSLLGMLQTAAKTPGDVQVAIAFVAGAAQSAETPSRHPAE